MQDVTSPGGAELRVYELAPYVVTREMQRAGRARPLRATAGSQLPNKNASCSRGVGVYKLWVY